MKTQLLRQRDFWAGAMFVVFGLFFAVWARHYNFGTAARMGPGFFPTILGCLLAGLGGVVMLNAFFGARNHVPGIAFRPITVLVLAICLYGLLLPFLGLVLATVVLVFAGAFADTESRRFESALLGVILSAFVTIVFHYGLGLPFRLWPEL